MKYNIELQFVLNGFYSNFEVIYKQLLVMMNDSFNDTSSIDNKTLCTRIDYDTNSMEDIINLLKLIIPIVKSRGTMGTLTDTTINRTVIIVYINNHLIIGNQSIMLLKNNKTISYITDKGIKLWKILKSKLLLLMN